jgi:serine/threonine protein kinase
VSIAPSGRRTIEPGQRLDRYELLCPIAEGGMASVWLARIEGKHGFERLVAIKTILPKYSEDDQFQRMLLDEARIAARVEHMNVARILDLGEHHEALYLVLEWVEGESLSRLTRAVTRKGQTIPLGVLLRILSDTCGGLHAAHELRGEDARLLGVVHRDVSPQNILVSTTGVAKLIDFGIAKARDRLMGDTNAGVLKGKVRYMAPEQAQGKPTDRRADIWAVGSILYRVISGKAPYEGENDLASLNMLTSGRPPAPLSPKVHPSIVAIVNRALSHAPEGRFATAADMQAAMEAAMLNAGLATTTSDVAAFAAEHLAPYTEKRQTSVRLALTAASERLRMRDMLQPMVNAETTDVSQVVPPSSSSDVTLVDDVEITHHFEGAAFPLRAPGSQTAGLVTPPPLPTSFESPGRRAPPSEPPTHTLETFIRLPLSMRTSVIAAGGVVTFLVVLVLSALLGRVPPKDAAAQAPAPRPSVAIVVPPRIVIPPPPSASAAPSTVVPVIVATDLPRARDPEPIATVRPPPAVAKEPAPATELKEDDSTVTPSRHNDGF